MIVPCPACQTRFNVNVHALSEAGRRVRCTMCGKTWHQLPNNKSNFPSIQPKEGEDKFSSDHKNRQDQELEDAYRGGYENSQNSKMNLSSRNRSQSKKNLSHNDKTKDGRRAESGGVGWLGWSFLIVVLSGLSAGGYLYHVKIVAAWPPAGPLFEMIGLGSEKVSLAIENVNWIYKKENGKTVLLVTGEVINISQKSQSVPRLQLEILDDRNRRIFGWTAATIKSQLDSGHVTKFSTRLADPPDDADSIAVTLKIRK